MSAAWSTMLFVRADDTVRSRKARGLDVDAVVLDLEDAVAPGAKADARRVLSTLLDGAAAGDGPDLVVRINSDLADCALDLAAAVWPATSAIMIPKAESAGVMRWVDSAISRLELDRGLRRGSIRMLPLVETASGLMNAAPVAAASERITALCFGPEDLSADLGCEPAVEALRDHFAALVRAARSVGRSVIGVPASIASFHDMQRYAEAVEVARTLGASGALAVHPSQIVAIRAVFGSSGQSLEQAAEIVAVFESALARGEAVARWSGGMVDRPVYLRARRLLDRTGVGPAAMEPGEGTVPVPGDRRPGGD